MYKKITLLVSGKTIVVDKDQTTLLNCLIANGIGIGSNCEGNGVCGKCQVRLDPEHYSKLEISESEQDTLEKQMNLTETSRLACQVKISTELDGAVIDIVN
ncbi:MAG: 2Fe-2S iron-sulfur cluster binding domain-containing protein [Rickettsiales bacterium]|jgi:ferredoxin|nr:2Fe-2S iron-sulfur cluster binding domain-containing protein [Rickettsiales bacterium]